MQQALGPDLATVSSFPESLQEARDVYRPQCWSSGDQGNANAWSKLRMVMACPGNGHPMPDPPVVHCGSVEPSLPPDFLSSSTPPPPLPSFLSSFPSQRLCQPELSGIIRTGSLQSNLKTSQLSMISIQLENCIDHKGTPRGSGEAFWTRRCLC